MPGLSTGLSAGSHLVVAGFYHELAIQLVAIVLVAVVTGVGVLAWRHRSGLTAALVEREPAARRLVRLAFGVIWVFDGVLQAQSSMPLAMVPQVVAPAAATSPGWVQALVRWGGVLWNQHPISVPASAVWIQLGIGVWLLVAPRGWWSRAAGLVSLGWSVLVWALGEAFGGIFAPGLSWLTGAPGGVVFYAVAGLLIALPMSAWTPRLGRRLLAAFGAFVVAMAVLQAWPGRGSWQGQSRHVTGNLTATLQAMAGNSQPHWLSALVTAAARGVAAHGGAVNLLVVVVLASTGALMLSGRRDLATIGVGVVAVAALADWVVVQDMGFWGGVGTDPNSMLPQIVLALTGLAALRAAPAPEPVPVPARSWAPLVTAAASLVAVVVVAVGTVPALAATFTPAASPVLAEAVGGGARLVNAPAPTPRGGRALLVDLPGCGAAARWEATIAEATGATLLVRGCATLLPAATHVDAAARWPGQIAVVSGSRVRALVRVGGPHSTALRASYTTVLTSALASR
ncbi:MAG: hypothetical protein ACP5OV_06815 [Acidimicrobiales bacterium]